MANASALLQIKFTTIFPYIVDTGLAQRPKVKFPTLMKIVSPQEAADQIVDSIRRNYFSNTIPKSMHYNVMVSYISDTGSVMKLTKVLGVPALLLQFTDA